jgi:hypothetical protein
MFLGTHLENMLDAKAKDRHSRGERSNMNKLTDAAVREIKAEYRRWREGSIRRSNAKELAARYGVGTGAITCVASGRYWKHIQ